MKLIQSVIILTILILSCTDSVVDDDTNDDPNWEYYSFKCTPDLKFEVNTTFPYGSDVKFTERLEGVFSIRMNYRYSYTTMAGNDTALYKEIYTRTNTGGTHYIFGHYTDLQPNTGDNNVTLTSNDKISINKIDKGTSLKITIEDILFQTFGTNHGEFCYIKGERYKKSFTFNKGDDNSMFLDLSDEFISLHIID